MSFNERADKQRGGGPELRPFIITSPMITLFHPLYQINITRHGLDDLQSHLISLDTAFTKGGWGSLYWGNCWIGWGWGAQEGGNNWGPVFALSLLLWKKLLVGCSETTYNAADKECSEDEQEWKITAKQHRLFEGANGEDIGWRACWRSPDQETKDIKRNILPRRLDWSILMSTVYTDQTRQR